MNGPPTQKIWNLCCRKPTKKWKKDSSCDNAEFFYDVGKEN